MTRETELIPFHASEPVGERVLVFAPHPDDESFGPGGTLRLLSERGKKMYVIFLTRGEKADPHVENADAYAAIWEAEAHEAMKVLGIQDYCFLGLPDRALCEHLPQAGKLVTEIMADFRPDTIYSPSPLEINPDHIAAAELAETICRQNSDIQCLFYEITTPLPPDLLVDISGVFSVKEEAIGCYASQLELTDYLRVIKALNTFRTFTLGRGVTYAEAFARMER